MRLIILAASQDDGLDWLDRFVDTPNFDRTSPGAVADVYDVRATIVSPESYDRLSTVLDPGNLSWLTRPTTKIIRTDAWSFDLRVTAALHTLNARHPLCDPTGLLGPQDIDRRTGWAPDGRTAPMGVLTQRNMPRQKRSVGRRQIQSV